MRVLWLATLVISIIIVGGGKQFLIEPAVAKNNVAKSSVTKSSVAKSNVAKSKMTVKIAPEYTRHK